MDLKQIIQEKKQYTVYSDKTSFTNSKQYTVYETRQFVDSLDRRVYRGDAYLPFYCKSARTLGFGRLIELQGMALDPSVKNPQRVFFSLILDERRRLGLIEPK